MIRLINIIKILVLLFAFMQIGSPLFSQLLYNNGAVIHAKEGSLVFVDGVVQNQSGTITVDEIAGVNGEFIIQSDFINNSTAGGDGYYRVLGDWVNNNTFNAGTGTVFIEGAIQLLSGAVATHFFNLTLDGAGNKTHTINQYVTGVLDLKHIELETEDFSMFVENTNTNAVIRTTGFVSSLNNGFLSRQTNASNIYLFPVGSSVGTTRYRPVEITPTNTNANSYTVRMANVNATTETFDRSLIEASICETNPLFYHRVDRSVGATPIKLSIFYDETLDGSWEGIANWTTGPNEWHIVAGSATIAGVPFAEAYVNAWDSFIETPYILYNINPDATITPVGPYCDNDASVTLNAVTAGGTWAGTGITDVNLGTFDPSVAGAGNHIITYNLTVGVCSDSDNITIVVDATPDATITAQSDLCITDAAVALVAATAGGTWVGTGVVGNTFDPTIAGAGTHNITYTVSSGGAGSTVVWSEDFGIGCDQGQVANGLNTGNGAWAVSNTGANDLEANEFFISATEQIDVGSCGVGCGGANDRTLHLGNVAIPAWGIVADQGASYNAGGLCPGFFCVETNKRAESPVIDLSGESTIELAFDYIDFGDAANDNGELWYFDGAVWSLLVDLPKTSCCGGPCDGAHQGSFTAYSIILPASADNNPNVKIGFFWTNNDDGVGTDPSFAVDNIELITTSAGSCAAVDNINIVVDPLVTPTFAPVGPYCEGDAIPALPLTSTNIPAIAGTWAPAIDNANTTIYTFTPAVGECATTTTLTITINAVPDATITAAGPFCTNDAAVNLTAATAGGTWAGTGITDVNLGTFDPSIAGVGNHNITYDITVGTCSDSDNISITVSASPDATITPAGPFCTSDASVNLNAVTAGGTWAGTGITDVNLGTFDPATAGVGNYNITYDITVGACSDSDNITIVVDAAPDATITAAGPFCTNDASVNLTAATAGGTWSGTGITDVNLGTFDPSIAGVGNHNITYDITVGTCSDSDNISITVSASPDATITPAGPFCTSDASVNLNAVTAGGTWAGTGITDVNLGTFDPATAGVGNHNITYNITVGACSDSDNVTIVVDAAPDATITAAGPFCTNDAAVNLTAATAGGTWAGTGITDVNFGTFDPATAGVGNHNITYDVTVGGCSDSDNISITVSASPDATITSAGPFCTSDASVTLSSVTAGGTWAGTGITDVNLGTFDPATAGVGNHNITYNITVGACSDSDNITIVVDAAPDATITAAGPFCTNDAAVNLTAATAGGTWAGTGITDVNFGTFDPATAGVGNHNITYDVTVGGCSDSDNISITVSASPDATITAAGPFCTSDASVTLSSVTAGGTWAGTGITDVNLGTFDPATAGVGNHNITYNITVGACSDSDNITIIVDAAPDATITAAGPFCTNDAAVNLTAATAGGTWGGTGITDVNFGTFDPATAGVGNHNITYDVTVGGCSDSDNISITVSASPNATITAAGPFCTSDASVNLNAVTAGGTWAGTGITDVNLGTFDPATAGVGNHNITYNVSLGACSDIDNITIVVDAAPDATITAAGPFCTNDASVTLTAATAGGTWAGIGITDVNLGTFDPATAGVGNHNITYDIIVGGCSDSDNISITVNASPDAAITPAGPFCTSDASVNLNAVTAGGTWAGTGITDVNLGTFDPATAGVGNHNITYNITVGACSDSDNITIVVDAAPDATITAVGPFCTNDASVTLAAATAGGTWAGTGITDVNLGTFDPATAGVGNHNITYDIIVGGCSDSDNISITVSAAPDATITPAGPFCTSDASVNLNAVTAGGTWAGTGITDVNLGTFDPATAGVGNHNITYNVSLGACSDIDNITIVVDAAPDATITAAGPFCTNDASVTLTAATAGGTWAGTGITDVNLGTFDPSVAGVGNHNITYDIIVGGCSDSDNISITVSASPNATITAAGPFCTSDASVTLIPATAGGTWAGIGITDVNLGTFDPTTAGIGNHNITYSITVGACSDSDNITITVDAGPDATITAAGPFCINDAAVTLIAATAGGTWSGTGITDVNLGIFDPSIAGLGSHNITYDVIVGACSNSDNLTIDVNASPDATINAAGPFCANDAVVTLTAATAGGTWAGTGITNANLGTFDPSLAGEGTHNITYDVTVGGCSDSDNISIVVNASPDATITTAGPFCTSDASVNLNAVTAGGTWSGTGITDVNNGVFDPSLAGEGSHVITYNVGIGSCSDSDNITIVVSDAPDASITQAGPFCSSDASIVLTAATPGGTWSGTGIVDENTGLFDPAQASSGNNVITYQVSIGSCSASDNMTINIVENANAKIRPAGPFCYSEDIVALSAETTGGTWVGVGVSSDGDFNIAEAGVGIHQVIYTIASSCGGADTILIIVNPSDIDVSYIVNHPVCLGDNSASVEFSVTGGTAPYFYTWGFGASSDTSFIAGLDAGSYTFTIVDANACANQIVHIDIIDGAADCIRIPDVFTPNGDGINDQWIIENIEAYPQTHILVYNRWGQVVYDAIIGSDPWDGTYNNKPLPTGSYIYIIKPMQDIPDFIGIVTIMK